MIGAANLSPVTKLFAGTSAVSRYNVERSQKLVKVQDFDCGQMRVSGCNNHYKFVLGAGKAKSVTNNLPILSVLVVAFFSQGLKVILNSSPILIKWSFDDLSSPLNRLILYRVSLIQVFSLPSKKTEAFGRSVN